MALVLVFAGLVPGLAAAGWALMSGMGFLVAVGVYMAAGGAGMLCAAAAILHRAPPMPVRPARSVPRPSGWGLPLS